MLVTHFFVEISTFVLYNFVSGTMYIPTVGLWNIILRNLEGIKL